MSSVTILATSITSFSGFLLNVGIALLILRKGRSLYHYLFVSILAICAIWDIGIFLTMVRNQHVEELVIYGYVVFLPCVFLSVLFFHFTSAYLGQVMKKTLLVLWIFSLCSFLLMALGVAGRITGIYAYSWGNIYRPDERMLCAALISSPLYYGSLGASIYLLRKAAKNEPSPIKRRHIIYITVSFGALGVATIKVLTLYGVRSPVLLPLGMAMNDVFAAVIGLAIIKERLFDITVIVKTGAIYSLLAAAVIFIFSLSEHLLATYLGELIGGHSGLLHILSVALVIAMFMPVKHRLEKGVEAFIGQRKLRF